MMVIKIGGNELDSAPFLAGLAGALRALPERPMLVHGGGRGTTQLMARLGLEARWLEGLRVTDEATLEAVVMGLVGQASTQLVSALVEAGLPALGLSGVDAGLVTAEPLRVASGELGAVGTPVAVAAGALQALRAAGFLPCIAPICRSAEGALLNVNADAVASAVAAALEADALLFLTNVPAVRIAGKEAAALTPIQVETAIAAGDIVGGMIPKTRAAVAALRAGVRRAIISDLDGLRALARGERAGTWLQAEASR